MADSGQLVQPRQQVVAQADATSYANSYARYLRDCCKRWQAHRTESDFGKGKFDIDFKKLKFYGVHDYAEVESSWDDPHPPVSTSNLARWMSRLPNGAHVWMPEIGVFATPNSEPSAPPAYDLTARTKQAKYLFEKLGKLKVGQNNSRIYGANYYQFCSGAATHDTSLRSTPAPAPGTNCGVSGGLRSEVYSRLQTAANNAPNNAQ